ncbi:Integration host factor alpha subunit [Bathymodiolus thermophilus thioautotrophic gill symbiont]|uniref:Integration host factor subunit alpha n=1 Tax=Bathymodiolus thermophilus thioautotrophic gill symbiont TaxID=2360 RepID=A0A1J5TW41_9GAMM|nr:integration host factor subunit alpha [Bathymodiolus thermophilus thioautotrophic gill symbiont]AYQ56498.1 Bacterial nucleoid DNA-binding protein [Bathymodiolus thermophilus thioautotrophic gill symbiont]OIR25059.1 integration host factor subunit alpha [Bathymodiolus thermophilus thioautotrophic gill symbiont]CAB5500981.1 Integration host factor alpha subunit [Bathymodiolus thermophilus thioautotrophic gill symbiont]CAB5502783.1 Integration host factor alpha subunit [Bathymodiolus thermophil
MSLTKKNIADLLAEQVGISQTQALSLTNDFFDTIRDSLAKGEDVKLSGFGNFVIKEKVARPGRNPKTGKPVMISARKVTTFKAGLKLKEITKSSG